MLSQISIQSKELMEKNLDLNEQNNFIKAVLQGVNAGVISVQEDGRIDLMNPSAEKILEILFPDVKGKFIQHVFPFFSDFFEESKNSRFFINTKNVIFTKKNHTITLVVRISKDVEEKDTKYIFTFDNISELIFAQRKAAWSEVARRIAHEIKNPLTPIQLSAERIGRKYGEQIITDKDIFNNCIKTIVNHVGQIGQMVDEFANFAKMPSAKFQKCNIVKLINEVIDLQKMAHAQVSYLWDNKDLECFLMLDQNLFIRAFTNLLQNAYDSFEGLEQDNFTIKTSLEIGVDKIIVSIEDNGKGLPKENREKLTEPYVTTRVKGTGLGLPIVKHIMEEHKGELILGDSTSLKGAKLDMIFLKNIK
jgi:two-component system nitrogen regulation sensor histidine kinase NtrY